MRLGQPASYPLNNPFGSNPRHDQVAQSLVMPPGPQHITLYRPDIEVCLSIMCKVRLVYNCILRVGRHPP